LFSTKILSLLMCFQIEKFIKDGKFNEILASQILNISLFSLYVYLELVEFCVSKCSKGPKTNLAIFLPALFQYSMCFNIETQFLTFKNLVFKLMSNISDKIQSTKLQYDVIGMRNLSFNLVNYIRGDSINYAKINVLAANFILNDECLLSIQKMITMSSQIVKHWPNLVLNFVFSYFIITN
jgi:hypothetical protein